jgi:hypothetical protein
MKDLFFVEFYRVLFFPFPGVSFGCGLVLLRSAEMQDCAALKIRA